MRTHSSDSGFTLVELLVATTISLIVLGTAMAAFKDAISMNDTATNLADASQNLRGGTNFLIRDLTSAGRLIPTGGIPIPSGVGAQPIARPAPPGPSRFFDNTTQTTLMAITTGEALGPTVDNRPTDIVTILTIDPILDICRNGPLPLAPAGTSGNIPKLVADGSSFNTGTNVPCLGGISGTWLVGDATQGQSPIKKGDLILFSDALGNSAIQTVTNVDASNVYFEANLDDKFGFNQRGAPSGSITQIVRSPPITGPLQALSAQRVLMWTYYVDTSSGGLPHLMRRLNMFDASALAGIVEDIELSYDVVDGTYNPVDLKTLPHIANGVTYTASQIRKVNVHIGVRSEAMSTRQKDYLRNHLSTVVSLRSLAYVDRYDTRE